MKGYSKVLRGIFVTGILAAMISMAPAKSIAGTELGQFCWTMSPFVDTLRVAITSALGPVPMYELHVRWRAGTSYQLLGAGTATDSLLKPGMLDMGFEASHDTMFFGGNKSCDFFATLDPATLSGPWAVQCPGPTHFMIFGTLVYLPVCPPMAVEGSENGRLAGE